jgi:adenylylsulfate kinase-like enzyme
MTIGLFGGWGTGKSSIVENLKTNLLSEKTPVVIFDVWKHDGDALRRTFLKNMDIQLSSAPYGERYVNAQNILSPQVFSAVKVHGSINF